MHRFGLLFWGDLLQMGGCSTYFLSAASLCKGLCGDTSVPPLEGDSLGLALVPGGQLQPTLPCIMGRMRQENRGPKAVEKEQTKFSLLFPPAGTFAKGCGCVSFSQQGSGDARGAKTSPTWVPGVEGEGQGWCMARDAEAELATPCCPHELGPVPPSPSQLPQKKSAGDFRQAAGAAGQGASVLGGFFSSVPWKYGVDPWHSAAPRLAAST